MTKPLDDLAWLRRAIALSDESKRAGFHPFATLIVDENGVILAQAWNASKVDRTSHAEMVALRQASSTFPVETLRKATLYSNAEPCAMCAGGAYWAGIGRVVYGLSEANLLAITGSHPENPTLSLPCRIVFGAGQRPIEVVGPLLEDEAAAVQKGFWV